ncbi:MAG: hypothetical protein HKN21_12470 [Candidatus Eisenbacteria bacterium]|uniref:Tetratricopeptide repeat protein n=1 Tax=Eiseniibacteriota bacterium TaxID=2212470 RepID=A0A7Y2H3B7_UNCEI|nr:hypothetical protein [Candidatus Eisenbacteria bacterium]
MSNFDSQEAHTHFGKSCYNGTWGYIDSENRSEAETEAMLHTAHASFWHWQQVEARTAQNDSIGYWQLSRVYALAKRWPEAMYYAQRCVKVSDAAELDPFFRGYGYEALARAHKGAGQKDEASTQCATAIALAEQVSDAESKAMLMADIKSL